ncbi:hypothetical protein [Streptomyces sp. SID13726]|uniref:hypothetical protein n=1 Tax=Streptomyces sp. SID13726 TaxID=2706058 RepID=UPI0013B8DA19|nr:hypothetical protein [Streptomyces sp. SID13726]
MAVSALTGCVTIQRPPVPGPPPTARAVPSQPSAPRPDGHAEPQIVQAPAQEALSMIDPSGSPKPGAAGPRGAAPGTAAAPDRPQDRHPAHSRPQHPRHPAHPARPEQGHQDVRHPRQPRVEIPDVAKSVPKNTQDVCALGRRYGRWQEGSPESVICDTYGR